MQVEPRPGGVLSREGVARVFGRWSRNGWRKRIRKGRPKRWRGGEREGAVPDCLRWGKRGIMNPERLRDPRCTQSIDSDVGGSLATSIDRHYIGKGQANQFVAALLFSPLLTNPLVATLFSAFLYRVLFNFPLFIFSHYTSAHSTFVLIQLFNYDRCVVN